MINSVPEMTVSYSHGKFMAAYLYLVESRERKTVKHTRPLTDGVIVDFDAQDRPIGVEVLYGEDLNEETLNRLLAPYGVKLSLPTDLTSRSPNRSSKS